MPTSINSLSLLQRAVQPVCAGDNVTKASQYHKPEEAELMPVLHQGRFFSFAEEPANLRLVLSIIASQSDSGNKQHRLVTELLENQEDVRFENGVVFPFAGEQILRLMRTGEGRFRAKNGDEISEESEEEYYQKEGSVR